jgi:AcrR family transcriptional regulator
LPGVQNLAAKKRTRQSPDVTRGQLLDATERLMAAEGYAAVTTRRVAAEIGLTAALVHYYYPTTEDLLIAAYRRALTRHEENIEKALDAEHPLHALWKLLTDSSHIAVGLEFAALANHRKNIRKEIAKRDEHKRRFQIRKLSRLIRPADIDGMPCSPLGLVMLMEGMSRAFVMDRNFGLTFAHAEARKFIEHLIDRLEPAPKPARLSAGGKSGTKNRPAKKRKAHTH